MEAKVGTCVNNLNRRFPPLPLCTEHWPSLIILRLNVPLVHIIHTYIIAKKVISNAVETYFSVHKMVEILHSDQLDEVSVRHRDTRMNPDVKTIQEVQYEEW